MRYYAKMYIDTDGRPYALGRPVDADWQPCDGNRDGCQRGDLVALAEITETAECQGFWVVPGSRGLREDLYRIRRRYRIVRAWRLGNRAKWREVIIDDAHRSGQC